MKEKILKRAKSDRIFRQACIQKLSATAITKQFKITCVIGKEEIITTGMGVETYKSVKMEGKLKLPHAEAGFKCIWVPKFRTFAQHFFPTIEDIGSVKPGSFMYEVLSECLKDIEFDFLG